jgi:hypothetical protein
MEFPQALAAVAFAATVIFGAVVESINSYLEVRWDSQREQKYRVRENWYQYLASAFAHEPIEVAYLSRLVTTMYLELALMFSIPVAALGAIAARF